MIKFTKRQQFVIDSQTDPRAKQNWIEQFTHIQEMKQLPEVKAMLKEERVREKRMQK